MNALQNNKWFTSKNVFILLLGVAIMYFVVQFLVDERFNDIESNTREQIATQVTLLTAIAETTARNGADATTESIVKDCTTEERVLFDTLLGGLNGDMSMAELTELERLFGRCGAFFSERKSVMVARLTREIVIFEDYVQQLSVISGTDLTEEYSIAGWKELSALEEKRSVLFVELVDLQDQIISQLLDGKTINSEEMTDILVRVSEVQGSLDVTNIQAREIRSDLIAL